MNTIEAFETWLTEQGYQRSTVVNYGKALVAMHTHGTNLPLLAVYVGAARAFLRWPEHIRTPDLMIAAKSLDARQQEKAAQPVSRTLARRAAQAKRKREARSIARDEFTRLAEVTWSDESPTAAVLSVLYVTGLRVGDVLGITRRALTDGMRTGVIRLTAKGGDERLLPWSGADDEWTKLAVFMRGSAPETETVADLVVGEPNASTLPGGAAYKRLDRLLKAHAETAGIDERVHLHRLRRTVAVRALNETRDIAAVQQMLGHRNIQTTARYVDEARPEALAGIQQHIHPRKNRKT